MRKIIVLSCFCFASLTSFAQFRIHPQGQATQFVPSGMDTIPAFEVQGGRCGLYAHPYSGPDGSTSPYGLQTLGTQRVGVLGEAVMPYHYYYYTHCGVKGVAGNGESGYNYGVMGSLVYPKYGAAIYGTIYNRNCLLSGKYAGYFDGSACVSENLQVGGYVSAFGIWDYSETSTGNLNTEEEQTPLSMRLANIDIVTTQRAASVPNAANNEGEQTETSGEAETRLHYAIETESIRKQFPELVSENKNGKTMVNYMELIPVLIQSVNELSKRVEELEEENTRLQRAMYPVSSIQNNATTNASSTTAYDISGRRQSPNTHNAVVLRKGEKVYIK